MKKQISLFALAAATVAVGTMPAMAQVPVGTQIDPSGTNPGGTSINATGANPEVITVSGAIPEFVEFVTVENTIELGNIGGPLWNSAVQGPVRSVTGRSNSTPGAIGMTGDGNDFNKNTDTGAGAGDAEIEFRANTYVRVHFNGADLTNPGPDAVATSDDYILPTAYRFAVKGKVLFAAGNTALTGISNYPNVGQVPVNGGEYAYYSAPVDAENTSDVNLVYSPGAPAFTGAHPGGVAVPDPNAPSGFSFMAEVGRNGLNDYRGAYSTQINVTYFKY